MNTKRRWQLSRGQTVEVAFATLLTWATLSAPDQSLTTKTNSLLQLEMLVSSLIRTWHQEKEQDDNSEAAKKP